MSTKKRKPDAAKGGQQGPAKGGSRHIEPKETFHLPTAMVEALERYVAQSRPQTSKSAVLRLALEEFLVKAGAWPPGQQEV
jgi:hypothetical protein